MRDRISDELLTCKGMLQACCSSPSLSRNTSTGIGRDRKQGSSGTLTSRLHPDSSIAAALALLPSPSARAFGAALRGEPGRTGAHNEGVWLSLRGSTMTPQLQRPKPGARAVGRTTTHETRATPSVHERRKQARAFRSTCTLFGPTGSVFTFSVLSEIGDSSRRNRFMLETAAGGVVSQVE